MKEGLSKVIISIHDISAIDLLKLEVKKRSLSWAEGALETQYKNMANLCDVGIKSRLNIVAYNSFEKTYNVTMRLLDFQTDGQPEIRLLNDLTALENSQKVINQVVTELGGQFSGSYQRTGSSNVTRHYVVGNKIISTKIAFPCFLKSTCGTCALKSKCYEGFYGIRMEKIKNEYFVRLCIYKQDENVLLPWQDFVKSDVSEEIRKGNIFSN